MAMWEKNKDGKSKTSPGGSALMEHGQPARSVQSGDGFHENAERVERHIATHLRPPETVWHEVVSHLVHIDVHVVPPGPKDPFITLVTAGMSAWPMELPKGVGRPRFAELCVRLPMDWPITQADFEDESAYWPIRMLKHLARRPHEHNTWLDFGHTIPNGDPPLPYAEDAQFCCALLLPPFMLPEPDWEVGDAERTKIRLMAVMPLYKEEMELRLNAGTDALLDRFEAAGIDLDIDISRPNVGLL